MPGAVPARNRRLEVEIPILGEQLGAVRAQQTLEDAFPYLHSSIDSAIGTDASLPLSNVDLIPPSLCHVGQRLGFALE